MLMTRDGSEKIWIDGLRHANEPDASQGRVQVSFELVPKHLFDQVPAGFGRSAPNMNPVLADPDGRIRFVSLVDDCGLMSFSAF